MINMNNFQRVGCVHNAGVGRDFEAIARELFAKEGVYLTPNFSVHVGVSTRKKQHRFDLRSANPPILVECKSHTWTQGGNMPSAKMTVWNEAMYYFHVAPKGIPVVCPEASQGWAQSGIILLANSRTPRSRGG